MQRSLPGVKRPRSRHTEPVIQATHEPAKLFNDPLAVGRTGQISFSRLPSRLSNTSTITSAGSTHHCPRSRPHSATRCTTRTGKAACGDAHRVQKRCMPAPVFERSPLERLSADGELTAYQHHGFRYGMDTLWEKILLNGLWEEGQAPWKTWKD